MKSTVWRERMIFPPNKRKVVIQGKYYPAELVLLALVADVNPEVIRKSVAELRAIL